MIDQLKKMTLNDLINIDTSKLNAEEVAYVEKRLVKEANRRLSRLKKSGKSSSAKISRKERKGFKTYKAPKGYKPKTVGGNTVYGSGKKKPINVRNKRVKNASEVQDFLKKKTTKVREIDKQTARYQKVIEDATGRHVTGRQAKRVGRLMSKAEELAGLDPTTKKTAGSPKLLAIVVEIVKSSKYIKNEDAEKIINTAITEGYEQAQQLLNDLNEEDAEGLDMDDDDIFN